MPPRIRFHKKRFTTRSYTRYVIGADVGGTNTNIGVAGIRKNSIVLLFSFHYKTKELQNLDEPIASVLAYAKEQRVRIKGACIAAAGDVKNNTITLTNARLSIDKRALQRRFHFPVTLINDFEAIAYGVNVIGTRDVLTVIKRKSLPKKPKAVIGAGTGLGKALLYHDAHVGAYLPQPSEGGHVDLPLLTKYELDLAAFLKKKNKKTVSYEDVLSGKGIAHLYHFVRTLKKFKKTAYVKEIDHARDKSPLIAQYAVRDPTCRETMRLYTTFYARCARNFALETVCSGGLYIAGGIAAKNSHLINNALFRKTFEDNTVKKELLRGIPVYLIKNYDISLYGSAFAAALRR